MFILKDFLVSLLQVFSELLSLGFGLLYIILVLRIILSWLGIEYYYNSFVQLIYSISEPILRPFRRLPLQIGMLDFSPILAFITLRFLDSFFSMVLRDIAQMLM